MTSTASQQNPIPAQSSQASAATSYASAAGANKKQTPTPLTGAHPPVVVGSAAPVAQNGKPSAAPLNNGRPNIPPAVPAVARSGSAVNGGPADHSRKSSVTISANAPPSHIANGGTVGGHKNIQFGFNESPAIAQSTLHQAPEGARPIPIPGVPSPAQSPSPIPQMPQQSGGQRAPSNTQASLTFGSFPGEGDRHMKQPSISHNLPMGGPPHPHGRRESHSSAHGDSGPGAHRGGFGRGRGGYNNANQTMGFPPRPYSGPNQHGRGGMAPPYQNRGGAQQYPNSPQPPRASPAMPPANLHHTPTMPPASLATGPQQFYPAPQMYSHHPQVKTPFNNDPPFNSKSFGKKNKSARQKDTEKQTQSRQANSWRKQPSDNNHEFGTRARRQSARWVSGQEFHHDANGGPQQPPEFTDGPPARYHFAPWRPVPLPPPPYMGNVEVVDLSPENGDFDSKLLTATQKQMQHQYPPLNQYGHPIAQYAPYGQPGAYMGHPGQANPGFQAPYIPPPPFTPGQPGASPMSRNPSQVSDRPSSSTGPSQPPAIVQGTPQQRPAAPSAPVVVSSNSNFKLPTKSKGIVIKDAQGKVVDLRSQMTPAPASPAPSIQQSRTPPIVSSTPTPPPKATTPSHGRAESTAGSKTAEQLRNEFKSAVHRATTEGSSKEEEAAKAAAEEKAKEEARLKAEEQAAAEKKAAEEAKAKEEAELKAKAEAEEKAKREAEEKAKAEKEKAEAEEKAKAEKEKAEAEEKAKAEQAKAEEKASAEPEETEDERIERMIREMEEEDARREKEQEAITARKKAEAEEAKKRAEANKKSAAEEDEELRRQEREMERLEEEREQKRKQAEASGKTESVADLLTKKIGDLKLSDKKEAEPTESATAGNKASSTDKAGRKPQPLNLAPLNTKSVEAPQPSAALQSLRTSRLLPGVQFDIYPPGIHSPNPALNAAVHKKGKVFKYDAQFLLQFQNVFTEQPSTEFHQQVKSLIGDSDGSRSASARTPGAGSGRQNSRANTSGGFPSQGAMGQFGSAPKLSASGTTSAERFAMSQNSAARPQMGGGMAFGRGGFPSGQLGRTPSSTGAGGIPNSPRQGSRRGGGSKRAGDYNPKAEQVAKNMPLTANMDIKPVTTSATGWKPTSIGKAASATASAQAGYLDPEMVQRKVKAALNKMTPEKFEKISNQILDIAAQSKEEQDGRTLRQVIQLTFEKATDEAHWASMYAKFCKRMLEMMSPEIRDEGILDKQGNVVSGGALFRKYLLNRCQEEFERGWKVDLPEPKEGEGKPGEAALLSDEYYIAAAAKRRGLGLVQFIGELYKLGMLTERIMHECVRKLLEFSGVPDEAEIESLTKLLRTIGGNLDSSEKGRNMMEVYFQRIDSIIQLSELPSRLKFMLMDVKDLRKAGWASKDTNKGPKTLEEIRSEAEAAAAQKAAESARNQRGGPGGRPGGGRGDSRNFSYTQAAPNTVGMDDLRRLKGNITSRSSSQTAASFGPTSMFNSRSNSGRRMGGPGGAFGRGGEDSGTSSRTGTPPVAHTNAFGLLADTGDHPASPPSTSASPAMSKVTLDTAASGDKKEE
ncbi:hypothetical protein V8F20_012088 [Naviculisporaceae sp. PSN 640]